MLSHYLKVEVIDNLNTFFFLNPLSCLLKIESSVLISNITSYIIINYNDGIQLLSRPNIAFNIN